MSKFAFNNIKALSGEKFKVMQLSIEGVNQLDKFEDEMEDGYKAQYRSLITFIDHYTNTGKIPGKKFKEITPRGAERKEFEFKTDNGIRLYAVQADHGRVIILCGYKGDQKKDIVHFRNLISEVLPKKRAK